MPWVFFVFFIIVESIVLFGHWLVYRTLVKFWPVFSGIVFVKLAFVLLAFSFVIFSLLANRFLSPIVSWGYYISAVWLGTLHFLFWGSLALWLIFGFRQVFGLGFSMTLAIKAVFITALATSVYGLWNSYQTKIVFREVYLPALPEHWQGKKLAVVADTHLGSVRNMGFGKKVAELVAKQQPAAVLIAGDFYDGPPTNFEELAQPFGAIKSEYGVFFANGNHEEFRDSGVYISALEKAGINVLNNKSVLLDGLQVLGVPYAGTGKEEGLARSLASINFDKNKPSILIKHAPSALSAAEKAGISLTVSGHSHKGQVWPGMYITRKVYKGYDYGLKFVGKMAQLTTSGAGTWGPPQRVGTQSEIVIITLR